MPFIKYYIGCSIFLVITSLITVFAVTFSITSSLNPLSIYDSGNLAAIIAVSLCEILLIVVGLYWLAMKFYLWSLSRMIGERVEDAICPGCGLPALQYVSSHGQIRVCPSCHKIWHSGRQCWRKDSSIASFSEICPFCREKLATREYVQFRFLGD